MWLSLFAPYTRAYFNFTRYSKVREHYQKRNVWLGLLAALYADKVKNYVG